MEKLEQETTQQKMSEENPKSIIFGFRKFFLCLVALLLLFIAIETNHIPGDTGAWAIVAIISLVVTGYAGEYYLLNKKATP